MKNRRSAFVFSLLLPALVICGCQPNHRKPIEQRLGIELDDRYTSYFFQHVAADFNCPILCLFRIDADSNYYSKMAAEANLVHRSDKAGRAASLEPYDQTYDNSLWALGSFSLGDELPAWWKISIDANTVCENSFANYYCENNGASCIGKHCEGEMCGRIFLTWSDNAIYGVIELRCKPPEKIEDTYGPFR